MAAELERGAREKPSPSYNLAIVAASLGDKRKAIELLERAYDARDPAMVFLKIDAKWASLRGEPRYEALLAKMNFPAD